MATEYIQIEFPDITTEQSEILIALLSESGFEGFEEITGNLKAFIRADNFNKTFLDKIVRQFNIPFSKSVIKETNWNQLWESNFQPVVIEDFGKKPWVIIRADFHDPMAGAEHEIIITPKMSFGTGHHATTSMMIQQMSKIDFIDKIVFDFGTGTGILSILAEKLGAAKVIAIDNDDWSVTNASENLRLNRCFKTELKKSDIIPGRQKFDVILANINKKVILDNFSLLTDKLKTRGVLLLSGFLREDEKDVLKEAGKLSIQADKITENNNWICIRFNR